MGDALTFLLLPDAPGDALHWWQLADGRLIADGVAADTADFAGDFAGGAPVIAIAIGGIWRERRDVDAQSARQAAAIARHQIADAYPGGAAAVHIISDADDAALALPIEQIRGWQHWLAAVGIKVAKIIPALAFHAPTGGWSRIDWGRAATLADDDHGFTDGAMLRAAMAGDAPVAEIDAATALSAFDVTTAPDLCQGAFAPARHWGVGDLWAGNGGLRCWILALAALFLLLSLALPLLQWGWAAQARAGADAQSMAAATGLVPADTPVGEITPMLADRAASLALERGRLARPYGALVRAMRAAGGNARITRLSWRAAGALDVQISADDARSVQVIADALQSHGWRVMLVPGAGGQSSRLLLEDAP